MAVDRLGILPKEIYIDLGVDAGTWSRWTSYEDDRTIPSGYLFALLRRFDRQAMEDLFAILRGGAE